MMNFSEVLKMALESIRTNALRSVLTLLIIAVGIMSLVGILTALDSVLNSLNESFNSLGSNSFTIERKFQDIKGNRGGRRAKVGEPIDFDQAEEFKERFDYPAKVTISINATGNAVVQRGDNKTNPTVSVTGADESYLDVKGMDLTFGRNFSDGEIRSGANKAIIGSEIVKLLFDNDDQKAVNDDISIGNLRYRVIGVLKSKGSGGGSQGADRTIIIPLLTSKQVYDSKGADYSINVSTATATDMEAATDVSTGLFRQVRKLRIGQDNDFEITKSDGLLSILKENTVTIRCQRLRLV